MPSGLQFDEVSLEPANAFLLGRVQGGQAAVLGYAPGRGSVECWKPGAVSR
jgi:hypothetical protein